MKLFMSVLVTDRVFSLYDRGIFPRSNRLDVFKYSLASLSNISWSSVFIYASLDDMYADEADRLSEYIYSMFPNCTLRLSRLMELQDWRTTVDFVISQEPANDVIWFSGNDDHIFIDRDHEVLNKSLSLLDTIRGAFPLSAIAYSHWPEAITNLSQTILRTEWASVTAPYAQGRDSIMVLTPELLRNWFFDSTSDLSDTDIIRRSEDINVACTPYSVVIPYRELVRHFDGYSHAALNISIVPPLTVPAGFFDKDIRLAAYDFGGEGYGALRKKGYTIIDPTAENYASTDENGVDLKVTTNEIPLFWRGRISELKVPGDYDPSRLIDSVDHAILDVITQRIPLTLSRAKELFPRAFYPQSSALDQSDKPSSSYFGITPARQFRLSKTPLDRNNILTVVIIDSWPHQESMKDLFRSMGALKSIGKIELIYVTAEDHTNFGFDASSCWWGLINQKFGQEYHDILDGYGIYRYTLFCDRVDIVKSITPAIKTKTALFIDTLFSCSKISVEKAVNAVYGMASALEGYDGVATINAAPIGHDGEPPTLSPLPLGGFACATRILDKMTKDHEVMPSFNTLTQDISNIAEGKDMYIHPCGPESDIKYYGTSIYSRKFFSHVVTL